MFLFDFDRHVYSSLSFITPVIIFTVAYNIPKFFELSVVTTYPNRLMNNSFSRCARKIFDEAELKSSSIAPSPTMTNIFDDRENVLVTNDSTMDSTIFLATAPSSSQKKIYFSVEQIYHKYLKECCNCTRNDKGDDTYLNENEENSENKNITSSISECDVASLCDVFISNLIEFLSSNISGKNITNSSIIDFYVR